jgi:fatty-acyl-CoA synthase
MQGLMMDYPLTIPAIVRRAETLFGRKMVVSRRPDKSVVRSSYAETIARARRLAVALKELGVQRGDRVATLAWNHGQHLEAYLAIPSIGAVLHTLNLRLHPDDLAFIASDADDRVLLADESVLPLVEQFKARARFSHIIVMASTRDVPPGLLDYERMIGSVESSRFEERRIEEEEAAAMCYTSGTTGRPKGVLYSHRALVLHSLGIGLVDTLALSEADTVLPVVPMFHVNAWAMPFAATFLGANQVLPGPFLDPASLLDLLVSERVTMTAGVPTVWLGLLQALDKNPGKFDLSRLRSVVCGGSAAPQAMIQAFQERHGLRIVHAWGMTEMSPLGSVCNLPSDLRDAPAAEQYGYRSKQGTSSPLVEFRARGESGLVPWDGHTMGELEVRGPWVARQYYNDQSGESRFTEDGWFKTGDIVTIDDRGCIDLKDRSKDLVKSGGEWISSVAVENALMGHPAVAEAAVIAVPHPKWDERPLAVVVLKPEQKASREDLLAHLQPLFAKWWIPEGVEFVDQIPRTAAGKFRKSVLRERFRDFYASQS